MPRPNHRRKNPQAPVYSRKKLISLWLMLRFLSIVLTLCVNHLTIMADERSARPVSAQYAISLDGLTPKSTEVRVPWPATDFDPVKNPQSPYLVRARAFQLLLTQVFRGRVSLAEIDLANQPGTVEYGLRVTAGPAEGLAKLKDLRGKLVADEVIATVQAGTRQWAREQDPGLLDDDCVSQIAEISTVRRIRLYQCRLTSHVWESIAKWRQLEELTLTSAEISGEQISNIASLTALRSVTLDGTNIVDADLAHFSKLDRLTYMSLYRCRNIGDAGVKAFRDLASLVHLELDGTQVGDAGLEHLSGLTNLTYLGLASTAVTDAGLVHLSGMRGMSCLILDGTAVNGSGLGALTKMPKMYQLQLMNSQLTGKNWLNHVPNMESYGKGLMFLTKGSKITPEEDQQIRKVAKGQTYLP
jgi:hypothetical protein